jgi:hypothetical protein
MCGARGVARREGFEPPIARSVGLVLYVHAVSPSRVERVRVEPGRDRAVLGGRGADPGPVVGAGAVVVGACMSSWPAGPPGRRAGGAPRSALRRGGTACAPGALCRCSSRLRWGPVVIFISGPGLIDDVEGGLGDPEEAAEPGRGHYRRSADRCPGVQVSLRLYSDEPRNSVIAFATRSGASNVRR